jgi:hypothetical protein
VPGPAAMRKEAAALPRGERIAKIAELCKGFL